MKKNKYGFGEYLREICELADGDCLNCKIYGLVTYDHDLTQGKPLCQVLQRLLTHNSTGELIRFVEEVTAYADKDDAKQAEIRGNKACPPKL